MFVLFKDFLTRLSFEAVFFIFVHDKNLTIKNNSFLKITLND